MLFVSSSCLNSDSIAEVIEKLAENKIRNIELSGGTTYYDGMENDLKKLKRMYCLQYICHAYFPPPREPFVVNLASCDDRIYQKSIDHYENCIDMLKRIECKVLSIHAGFLVEINTNEIGKTIRGEKIYDENKAYDRFCTAYEHIAGLCSKNKIALFLENNVLSKENYQNFHNKNLMMMTDYGSILKMKKQIDFDLLLDLGHLNVSARTLGLDYTQQCEALRAYAKWIHISDNNGVFDEHKPIDPGSNILAEFSKLYKPDINVTLETVGDIAEILESKKIIERCKTDR